ncbi:MAG: hypothetical protein JXB39_12215 [Deltaproteobacteria bacterium]|nr:hypothetical protein [Deltaproteobacteria bacterium]
MTRIARSACLAPLLVLASRAVQASEAPAQAGDDADEKRIRTLEEQVRSLQDQLAQAEMARILDRAEIEALAPVAEERPEDRVFTEKGRSLQAANPEISVSGDFVASLDADAVALEGSPGESGLPLRSLGLTFQSVLDPFSFTKIAIDFTPDPEEPVALEEAYITWSGLVPSLSLSLGRFRQQFGVVNRWHEHDLDQVQYPLPLEALLGPEGLVGNGLNARWFMPRLWADAQDLTIEVVDGDNATLFSGEAFCVPAGLAHLRNYWDLSESTYLELGLTGMGGANRPPEGITGDGWGRTWVGGADLMVTWVPPSRARYRSFTWRSEALLVEREEVDGSRSRGLGGWSYVVNQFGPRWYGGVRGEAFRLEGDDWTWRVGPTATFWQSEFVFIRLEYGFTANTLNGDDHRVLLQASWAAGPHKHEKY